MRDIDGTPLLAAMRDAKEVVEEAKAYFLRPAPAIGGRLSLNLEGEAIGDPVKIARLRAKWGFAAAIVNSRLRALGPDASDVLATIYKADLL